jgi:hypothetical protein
MANTDFFGYKRQIKPNGQLISSEFATLSLEGSRLSLVQSVQASYGQRAEPKFEAGSASLYWVTGQPMGTINIGRLVGKGGLKALQALEGGCGKVKGLRVSFDGEGGCEDVSFSEKGLRFGGAVPVSVGVNFSIGQLEIGETVQLNAAQMSLEE